MGRDNYEGRGTGWGRVLGKAGAAVAEEQLCSLRLPWQIVSVCDLL